MASDVDFVIQHLRETTVFSALDEKELAALAELVETVSLPVGATLVEQGETSSGIYLLVSGRLRAFGAHEDGTESIFGDIAPGELVGEMEVISSAPRVATVRAVRGSRLLRIDHETFDRTLKTKPRVTLAVAQVLAERLDRANRQQRPSTPHRTISIVPAGDSCADAIREVSEHVAAAGGGVIVSEREVLETLGEDPSESLLDQWLHRREADAHLVVYVSYEPQGDWVRRCLERADRVVVIDCSPGAVRDSEAHRLVNQLDETEWGPAVDVVCLQAADATRALGAENWRSVSRARVHHFRRGNPADLARLGRCFLRRDIGVVLSGGGARGMAHVGVLKAFEESEIPIDVIGGSSFGAIVAFLRAQDMPWQEIRDVLWETVGRPGAPIDATIPAIAISKGERLREVLTAAFATTRIEEAWINCFCMASNLSSGEPVVITEGSMVEALRASVAIPGVFPPVVSMTGEVLVDGSVMNNLPVDVMAGFSNGGPIVAVSLRQSAELAARELPNDGIVSGWKLLAARMSPFRRRLEVPSMIELLARSNETAGAQATRAFEQIADFVLHPPKGGHGFLEFGALDALIESGYRYTMKELEAWQAAGRTLGGVPES